MSAACCNGCNIFLDFLNKPDLRVNFPLMQSLLVPFLVCHIYLLLVYIVGPSFMRNRQAYSLKYAIMVYNILQMIANGALFLLLLRQFPRWSWSCIVPAAHTIEGLHMVKLHYCFLLLKFSDLTETMFFVLRKKDRQISFLHIYHHIGMVVGCWISTKYFPGGHGSYIYLYNTFVHFIMYFYYLKASWTARDLWWKPYVTLLQLVQHYLALVAFVLLLFSSCTYYPKYLVFLCVCNNFVIIYLFSKFYIDNYTRKKLKTQ